MAVAESAPQADTLCVSVIRIRVERSTDTERLAGLRDS